MARRILMNTFTYSYPTKQYFGRGSAKIAFEAELGKYGKNVMLAYGGGSIKINGIYDEIYSLLKAREKNVFDFKGIMPNPTYSKVQEGAKFAVDNNIDLIVAVGGGSVIDCCKIISAQAKSRQDIWELEFTRHKMPTEFIPMAAVVTASGTGAEQNAGAVITHKEKKIKTGVFGAQADFAVLDPMYTLSLPLKQVISGAFDSLSHCMETYFGRPSENNLSDDINEAVMRSIIKNMRRVIADTSDVNARSELMWASAMGENGMLKIGKLTDFQAHQIEHQLGAYTDCNHGQGLAAIHPTLYRHIYSGDTEKFARFAVNVWGVNNDELSQKEIALAGIDALRQFIKEVGLPEKLSQMNIPESTDFHSIAYSCNISAGCCKKLTHEEIFQILKECY